MNDTVDFRKLLDVQADTIQPPKALPTGNYFGNIKSFETGQSSEKQTPFIRFHFTLTHASPDIEESELEGIDLAKKNLRTDFYLTDDSKYRIVQFLESVGLNIKGRTVSELLPETQGLPVQIAVTQRFNKKDPSAPPFNEVAKVTGA